jgi:large subunit ribosomal protein L17
MRHNKKFNHLGRTSSHRQAMLSNMASSLIKHKRIFTTTAKAKALRRYVEPLISKAKDDTTHSRRIVFAYLQDKYAVTELFTVVSQKVGDRPGGYTRILKTGNRLGDNAAMCFIELVDFNENMLKETKKAAGKTRRSRRKSGEIVRADVSAKEAKLAGKAPERIAEVQPEPQATETSTTEGASEASAPLEEKPVVEEAASFDRKTVAPEETQKSAE